MLLKKGITRSDLVEESKEPYGLHDDPYKGIQEPPLRYWQVISEVGYFKIFFKLQKLSCNCTVNT